MEDREYFEARVTEVWDDSVVVEESLQSHRRELDDELDEPTEGKTYFHVTVSVIA